MGVLGWVVIGMLCINIECMSNYSFVLSPCFHNTLLSLAY